MWKDRGPDRFGAPGFAPRPVLTADRQAVEPAMGTGPCSFPSCHGGGGFRPCEGYTGQAEDCLNCGHAYSYHA